MIDIAESYWQMRFTDPDGVKHHSQQNYRISRDFLNEARNHELINQALGSEKIIEIGCGTGELADLINTAYRTSVMYPTDFSRQAVNEATRLHPLVFYRKFDILKDSLSTRFDLAISSNVLEHFKDYRVMLEKMFALAPMLLLLVPYHQNVTDGYDMEGGAGHAVSFTKASFKQYRMLDSFIFETMGWTHSGRGEKPRQLAILLAQ